ncbi:unnamed protein product, partial [Heterosigma akashiwo]
INAGQVKEHLETMQRVYEHASQLDAQALYSWLLHGEAQYSTTAVWAADPQALSFPRIVHQLHPVIFANDLGDNERLQSFPPGFKSVQDMIRCPQCQLALPEGSAYKVHIEKEEVSCSSCGNLITFTRLCITKFCAAFNSKMPGYNPVTIKITDGVVYSIQVETLLTYEATGGTWGGLARLLRKVLISSWQNSTANSRMSWMVVRGLTNTEEFAESIRNLLRPHIMNLSPIFGMDLVHGMYRQLLFISKVCPGMDYWTNDSVISTSIQRYNKFLAVLRRENSNSRNPHALVPTIDIDIVWHTHQTQPVYMQDTLRLLGRHLDHDDTIPGKSLMEGFANTCMIWARKFKEPYSTHTPRFSDWMHNKQRCMCSIICPPVGVYHLLVWRMNLGVMSSWDQLKLGLPSPEDGSYSFCVGTPVMEGPPPEACNGTNGGSRTVVGMDLTLASPIILYSSIHHALSGIDSGDGGCLGGGGGCAGGGGHRGRGGGFGGCGGGGDGGGGGGGDCGGGDGGGCGGC